MNAKVYARVCASASTCAGIGVCVDVVVILMRVLGGVRACVCACI